MEKTTKYRLTVAEIARIVGGSVEEAQYWASVDPGEERVKALRTLENIQQVVLRKDIGGAIRHLRFFAEKTDDNLATQFVAKQAKGCLEVFYKFNK